MTRIVEPNLIMNQEDHALAYALGGSPESSLASMHMHAVEQASKTISECNKVIDLGTGTGYFLTKLALVNPKIEFIGLDLSEEMLRFAEKKIKELNLKNVRLEIGNMCELEKFKNYADGVTSSLALHHLPNNESLDLTFNSIAQIFQDRTPHVYIFDMGRVKNDQTIIDMMRLHKNTHEILFEDGYNSSKAAFSVEDFKSLVKKHKTMKLYLRKILAVPYILELSTKQNKLQKEQVKTINEFYSKLSFQNKQLYWILKSLMVKEV